jgi:GalNAc-alpha-(1->4)-GalNAc-alpha-(1->3)-diNAcBac-PP-undecaprenol alpha-1,4-N-acetyl-D-galactosaminyltransferase
MRIALIIYDLGLGGAERVASTLVNNWAKSNDEITLVTIETVQKDFYSLDPPVRRIALGLGQRTKNWGEFILNNLRRVYKLRKLARSGAFDVLVSFGDYVNVELLLATWFLKIPVIVAEHTDPRKHAIGTMATWMRRLLYPHARLVVVLTPDIGRWASEFVNEKAVRVIPNPINEQFLKSDCLPKEGPNHAIVAMGRMVPLKGFDLLLQAFAQCVDRHPTWKLRIFGEGPEYQHLCALTENLKIKARVRFEPVTREPEKAMRESDLFVLSSRHEGFPMVLLEAMATGMPVISFDCLSGPREMIRNGVDGILVPPEDVGALAKAMDRLMESEEERLRLGARAVEIDQRFGLTRVTAMWRSVFEEVVA